MYAQHGNAMCMYLQRIKEEMRSMAFLTFRGGIHPYDGKDLSKNCSVEKYLPKGDLAILVSQHLSLIHI